MFGFTGTGNGDPATSDKIDLRDISFASYTATYSNQILTVSDGIDTAHIHFVGNYELANFHFSNDGFGGTLVTDPPVGGTDQETSTAQNAGINPPITETAAAAVVSALDDATVDIEAAGIADNNDDISTVLNHQAPVIVTGNLTAVQNLDGTTTVLGVEVNDSDPLCSTQTYSVTTTTGAAASPATDKVTLTVRDIFGANDTVNFVFNHADPKPNVALQGISGKDVIFATSSQDVLTGGAGQDQFLFAPTSSGPIVQHTITDFEAGIDTLDVRQFGGLSASSIPGAIQQQGGDTLITLDAHDTLLLKNLFAASVHASDFIVHF